MQRYKLPRVFLRQFIVERKTVLRCGTERLTQKRKEIYYKGDWRGLEHI